MHVTLIAPAPFDTLSGGYVYDRRMVEALRGAGNTVEVAALDGVYPLTDQAARAAARATWEALPNRTRPIIDGLALPAFLDLGNELARRDTVGLIHHPTALETGHSEQDRLALRRAERQLMPLLPRIIVTSEPTAERLAADFGVQRARIAVVVPGTEEAPRSRGSGDSACHILSVGTLVPRKGHDLLLRALARLFDLEWCLTIAGSPARDRVHARTLSAMAEELGITNRVRFAGEIPYYELETLWREADLFALATHWEGYGMAVAEALRRGLPIAVTTGGAAASLVPLEAGVICPPGDHEELSRAMRRLIFSPELRHDMAEAAWQAGQKLPTWQTQTRAFAAALADSGSARYNDAPEA
jgi:glycosyltransferase involved in cell wall biosynthesis